MLNKLLLRQVQKHFGTTENLPPEFSSLFKVISESYDHYEKDRNMLERSIELSSNEMIGLHDKLRKESAEVKNAHYNLKTLFENINEFVFSVGVDFKDGKPSFKSLQMSPACLKVYGYPSEDFYSNPGLWRELAVEEDKHILDYHFPLLVKGESFAHDYRIRHKDGTVRWISTKITPTLDAAGKLIRLDGVTSDINEKKISEKKLKHAIDDFNKLFNNINEVLYSVDMVSYKLIQMSAACEKVYGYTPHEFLMQEDLWENVIHPDDKHISRDQVQTLNKGQQVFNQYRIIHRDGTIRWIENKVIPTLDETGRLVRLDGLTNDITAKRISAQKLQESEMRFRTLIENSADMLTLIDANSKIFYESPAVTNTLGYITEENSGRSGFELIHPEDIEKATQTFTLTMQKSGMTVPLAVRVKTKAGNYIFTEGNVTNMLNIEGINAIVCNFRDVTKRVEAEQGLSESRKRYKMVFENPFLGIAIGTIDGCLQNVNDAFCKMLGYTQEELHNQHFSKFTLPGDMEKELPFILKMANGEINTYQLEKRYITKSKELIWVELSISCVKNESGAIQFVVAVVQDITPKKTAEESLRKSEVNLSAIIENTDANVYSLDKNCCYITFNSMLKNAVKQQFNVEIKPGDNTYGFYETINPEEAKFWKETYAVALTGQNLQFVREYNTDQHRAYISFSIHPIVENNEVIGLSCFSRDITQQKLAEESLYKSEANLRNILENTDTAYVLLNKNATILSYNHISRKLAMDEMGATLEEGKNYIELMREDRRKEVGERIQNVVTNKKPVSYETKYATPGKPDKWLTVSMYPILDENKNVLGLSVAALDISDRKNTEQLIKQSNERYELVTKATNDVIWDWDIKNNKLYRSDNYKQVFGYSESGDNSYIQLERSSEQGSNKYVQAEGSHIHFDDGERIFKSIMQKIEDSNAIFWEDEYRYYRQNNELAYVQDRGYIIYDENKKPVRMVGAMRDITAEKLFAIERDKITSDLIRQNKNLEQFAYIVSHNLRAPIANISGLLRILQTPKLEEKTKKRSMDGLMTSLKKLDDVIIDLAYILQVKREIDEKREAVMFSSLLEDIKLSVRNSIEKENVSIVTDFSAAAIFSVKSYLHSIFYNLISNSMKYKQPGRDPVIEISSRETESKTTLIFKDNGSGIDLTLFGDKIFGLYKRFHYDVEGRGMGLFMVKTQVESLEGNISVTSKLNEGTIFTIEFEKKLTAPNLGLQEKTLRVAV